MAYVMTDAGILVDQYNLSGDMNSVALEESAEAKDATTFGQTTRVHKGGLLEVQLRAEGLVNHNGTNGADDVLPGMVGNTQSVHVVTVAPQGLTEGNLAYLFAASLARYQFGARMGDLNAFSLEAAAVRTIAGTGTRPRLARGQILLSTGKTAGGSGTVFQLGAVSSTQRVYVGLHVVANVVGLPSFRLLSAPNNWASPTTRITLTPGTVADYKVLAGPVTDTYWRADWDFSGTSFTAVFVAAII